MARIWAKIITGEKILKDCMIDTEKYYNIDRFVEYMQDICYELDIPNKKIIGNPYKVVSL